MENRILGLYHITAIGNQAKRNVEFYMKLPKQYEGMRSRIEAEFLKLS